MPRIRLETRPTCLLPRPNLFRLWHQHTVPCQIGTFALARVFGVRTKRDERKVEAGALHTRSRTRFTRRSRHHDAPEHGVIDVWSRVVYLTWPRVGSSTLVLQWTPNSKDLNADKRRKPRQDRKHVQAPARRSCLSPIMSCERHVDRHTAPCSLTAWTEMTRTNTVNTRADTLATQNASRSSYPSTCARGNPCKHVLIIMRSQLAVGRSLVVCSAFTHA